MQAAAEPFRPTSTTYGDEATVGWWLAVAERYPLLDVHTERELGSHARHGSKHAREALCNHNLRLAISMARTVWRRRRVHLDGCLTLADLIQEANAGLLKAIDCYDERIGRFTTHATWWIRQAIGRAVLSNEHSIRLPEFLRGAERVAARPRMDRLERVIATPHNADEPLTLGSTIADVYPGPEEQVVGSSAAEELHRRLAQFLTPTQLYVVSRRIGLLDSPRLEPDPPDGPTFRAIGRELHISGQGAQNAWSRSLTQLRIVYDAPAAAMLHSATPTKKKKSAGASPTLPVKRKGEHTADVPQSLTANSQTLDTSPTSLRTRPPRRIGKPSTTSQEVSTQPNQKTDRLTVASRSA